MSDNTSADIVRDRKAKQALASQGFGLARFEMMNEEEREQLANCNPNSRESIMRVVAANNERNKATEDVTDEPGSSPEIVNDEE